LRTSARATTSGATRTAEIATGRPPVIALCGTTVTAPATLRFTYVTLVTFTLLNTVRFTITVFVTLTRSM
jgi:hypothetical protein